MRSKQVARRLRDPHSLLLHLITVRSMATAVPECTWSRVPLVTPGHASYADLGPTLLIYSRCAKSVLQDRSLLCLRILSATLVKVAVYLTPPRHYASSGKASNASHTDLNHDTRNKSEYTIWLPYVQSLSMAPETIRSFFAYLHVNISYRDMKSFPNVFHSVVFSAFDASPQQLSLYFFSEFGLRSYLSRSCHSI